MKYYLAIDIGGTQMRGACYPENSLEPVKVERIATHVKGATPLERLLQVTEAIWPADGTVAAIAAAAPGPLDPYQGIMIDAPNIPGWEDMPLRQHLVDHFHVPVGLGNDANLAAMGEWKFGAGKGHHHLIYITVSTGIGGGVILEDHLIQGSPPDGHRVGARGRSTAMGQCAAAASPATWNRSPAGPAIARWAQEQLASGVPSSLPTDHPLTAKEVSAAAKKGDPLAVAALARAGRYLGWALADYLHIFNPTMIIIGGGVSQSGPLLFDPLKVALYERVMNHHYTDGLQIVRAELGDDVGLMGALALAQETAGLAQETAALAQKSAAVA